MVVVTLFDTHCKCLMDASLWFLEFRFLAAYNHCANIIVSYCTLLRDHLFWHFLSCTGGPGAVGSRRQKSKAICCHYQGTSVLLDCVYAHQFLLYHPLDLFYFLAGYHPNKRWKHGDSGTVVLTSRRSREKGWRKLAIKWHTRTLLQFPSWWGASRIRYAQMRGLFRSSPQATSQTQSQPWLYRTEGVWHRWEEALEADW